MPKPTYHNLDDTKKKKIIDAGFTEFSDKPVHLASVNTIVKNAGIPKGSFYQYFEDKEDFYWYIVDEVLLEKLDNYNYLLRKHKGDIFLAEESLLSSILELFTHFKSNQFIHHVFQNSYIDMQKRLSAQGSMIYIQMYDILLEYGFPGLTIRSKEDFINVFSMIRNITNHIIVSMVTDLHSKEWAIETYRSQVNILKRGIAKRLTRFF